MARWYTEDGVRYPSVTTVLDIRNKPELNEWKLRVGAEEAWRRTSEATDRGTLIHQGIEDFLNNRSVWFGGEHSAYFDGFMGWYEKFAPTDITVEITLISHEYKYAGRTDLVCKIDGEWWIIDFKTSKRFDPGMGLQLAAYRQAYQEQHNLSNMRMGIVQLTDEIKRGYRFKEYNEPFAIFKAHLDLFFWVESHKAEEGRRRIRS